MDDMIRELEQGTHGPKAAGDTYLRKLLRTTHGG
jgi:hypothetical protein